MNVNDKRVGKMLKESLPKCPNCNAYMDKESYPYDREHPVKWCCRNCECTFEVLNNGQ